MSSALSIFEQRATIEALMLIKNNPGFSKTMIMGMDPTRGNTIYKRINDLISAGLVDYEKKGSNWTQMRLYLSPTGQEIAAHFEKIEEILSSIVPKEDNDDTE